MDHILVPLRRIILLQGLEQATGQKLSNEMLQRLLKANGQHGSLAEVNEQINWFENHGYVKMTRLGESSFILVHFTHPGGIRMGRKAP